MIKKIDLQHLETKFIDFKNEIFCIFLIFLKKLKMQQLQWITVGERKTLFQTYLMGCFIRVYFDGKNIQSFTIEILDESGVLLDSFNEQRSRIYMEREHLNSRKMLSIIQSQVMN